MLVTCNIVSLFANVKIHGISEFWSLTVYCVLFSVHVGMDGGTEKMDVSRRYIHWW